MNVDSMILDGKISREMVKSWQKYNKQQTPEPVWTIKPIPFWVPIALVMVGSLFVMFYTKIHVSVHVLVVVIYIALAYILFRDHLQKLGRSFSKDFLRLTKVLTTDTVRPVEYSNESYVSVIAERHLIHLIAECIAHQKMQDAGMPIHYDQITREEKVIWDTYHFFQQFGFVQSDITVYWASTEEALRKQFTE